MEITLNQEQRLFVLSHGEGYSCLGFDVVFRQCRELEKRIRERGLCPPGVEIVAAKESEIGTIAQYQHYQNLWTMVGDRKIGTWFDYETPAKVRRILEQYRKNDGRLRLFYGDRITGRDWMEENDVVGRIGRSCGRQQIPLLIAEGEDGGRGVLDSCIVRIVDADTREELYRHGKYHLPEMQIRSTESIIASWLVTEQQKTLADLGYTHGVWVQGANSEFENRANFRSYGKAAQWVAFMSGECMEQPN